jgi:peroxiredoxin
MRFAIAFFALLFGFVAQAAPAIPMGPWRVVLEHPPEGLPFTLTLEASSNGPKAYFVNGAERMPAETVQIDGKRLEITFPSYQSRLTAELQPDGTLKGEAVLTRRLGEVQEIVFPLVATHGQAWRFFKEPAKTYGDVSGTWAVEMANPPMPSAATAAPPPRKGIAIFNQIGPYVTGTIAFVSGDYRYLAGEMRGEELHLSTWDGGQGTVWRAKLGADGALAGQAFLKSYGFPPLAWGGKRDDNAKLEDRSGLTRLTVAPDAFGFTLPDLDGKLVSLADFKGKVVIATIGGTWCPTCHDEAAFLAPWIKANRSRGVEAIGLQFEYTDDIAKSVLQSRRFAQRYGIDYPMLIGGRMGPGAVAKVLPIEDFRVYPTTIFIDRKGVVRKVSAGFPGPAMGAAHAQYLADFKAFAEGLIREAP